MLRHELQSIRKALAMVLHHSYGRVHTQNGAPRSQSTATRAGARGESDEKKYRPAPRWAQDGARRRSVEQIIEFRAGADSRCS